MKIQNLKLKSQNLKSKFKTFNFLIVLFTFNLLLFTLATKVANGQSLSLGIYPPLLEVTLKPGKSITQVYKITNNSEQDLIMNSQIVPFEPSDELGNVEISPLCGIPTECHYPFLSWFSFQNADLKLGESFVLKAGSEQQVVLKIKIPEDAPENDYYLTLLFESQPENTLEQSASQAKIKIGANILLTISENGEPLKKAQITEFRLSNFSRGAGSRFAGQFKIGNYQFIDSFANPEFILRIKNIGKTFFKPNGTITISGWTGQKYLLDLLPENIINQSIRQLQCFSTENNSPVPCRLVTSWKTKFLIGLYQAQVSFSLDKTGNDYQQTIKFIALPFKLLGGILAIILISTLIIALARHFK